MALPAISPGLRQTARRLKAHPGLTTAIVLTLALGLGATTAIFAVVYGVLLKPLPYPDSNELVSLRHTVPGLSAMIGGDADDSYGLAESMYVTYRDEARVFEHVGLWTTFQQTLTGTLESQQVTVLAVASGTLQALGVQPTSGRWFSDSEYTLEAVSGSDPVILSYAFWQRRFGGDAAALGGTLALDGRPAQIVGIMPATFSFLDVTPQPDIISAVRTDGTTMLISSAARAPTTLMLAAPNYAGIARLKDGFTAADANLDVARLLSIWLDAWPSGRLSREAVRDWGYAPALMPLKDEIVGGVAGMLWVLMGAVGAVLLIATANIANLLLARADARAQEFAIRATLGAGRRQIAGEFMREGFILCAVGGIVGIALARAGIEVLTAFAPPNLPRVGEIAIGGAALAFASLAAVATGAAFGAIPAVKHVFGGRAQFGVGPRGATASRERNGTRHALIVVQVALALVLLVGAGLMIRTFQSLSAVDPGFRDAERILAARIFIPPAAIQESERYTRVYREALERIEALPGVTAAGFGNTVPLEGGGMAVAMYVEDRFDATAPPPLVRRVLRVSPGHLEALATRVIAGRTIEWADLDRENRNVALVSANLARELWGEPQAAIGKRIRWTVPSSAGPWQEIVGVTQDVYQDGLHRPAPAIVYSPLLTQGSDLRGVIYAVRSGRAQTESFASEVRQAVWASHPEIVVTLRTMQDIYSNSLARTSFMLVLLAIAGAMALFLSVVGVYGVTSYFVSQRTREIGIRLALGAAPTSVQRMFVRSSITTALIGIAAGLVVAAGLSRFLMSQLFEVRPLDFPTYLTVLGALLGAVTLAAYLPARRAAKLDPAETLRAE